MIRKIEMRKEMKMEHYLTKIEIKKLRHLENIKIALNNEKRQHLLLTGKNGSGKTTVLMAIQQYLRAINDRNLTLLKTLSGDFYRKLYINGLELEFNEYMDLDDDYESGKFIAAYFSADRKTRIERAQGVSDIKLKKFYRIDEEAGSILIKYMVHLKTQQAYARNESDTANVVRIEKWFNRLEQALKVLFDDENLKLKYNYKDYDFQIIEEGREPFGFDQLSDGYSSVVNIVSDLILRMDKNWLLKDELSEYDIEGIVLIDELETHLHIELQKKILPFLTTFFPKIQFIVTTHSPYILNSISNAKAYDLEKRIELENLSEYSSDDLAEAYFDTDEYAEEVKWKLMRYEELVEMANLSEQERAERAELRWDLERVSTKLTGEVKDKFEEIELQRKKNA